MMYAKCNIHRLMILYIASITCSLCSVLPYVDKNHREISDNFPDEPLILENTPFNGFPSVPSPDSPDSLDSPSSSFIETHHQHDLTSIRPNDDPYSISTDFLDSLNQDEKLTEKSDDSEKFKNVIKNPFISQDRGNEFISDGNRKKADEVKKEEDDEDKVSSSISKDDAFVSFNDPKIESHHQLSSPTSLASSSQTPVTNVHSSQELPMPPDYTDEWPSSFDHHPRNLHYPHNVNIFPSQPSPPPPLMSSSSTPSQPISTSSRLLSHLIPSSSPSMISLDESNVPISVLKPSSTSSPPPSISVDDPSSGLRSLPEMSTIITVSSSTPVPEVKSIDYAASLIKDLLKSTWSLFKDQNSDPKEEVDGADGSGTKFEDHKSVEGEKNPMIDPLATDMRIENGEEELLGEVEKLILQLRQIEAMEAKKLAEAEKENEGKDENKYHGDEDDKSSDGNDGDHNKDDNINSNHHKSRNNRNRLTHQMDYVEQLLNEYRSKQGVINLRHWARGVSTPRLSVTSPIAVLRDALMEEIRRKRLKEQQERIKENKKMLDEIG